MREEQQYPFHKECRRTARRFSAALKPLVFAALLGLLLCTVAGCGGRSGYRAPEVRTLSWQEAPFISGKNTTVFHRRSCVLWREIPKGKRLGFRSIRAALAAGKVPCAFCRPALGPVPSTGKTAEGLPVAEKEKAESGKRGRKRSSVSPASEQQ